jgi:hypothetical protein
VSGQTAAPQAASPSCENGEVTEPITIVGLDVDDRRRLVLKFSREPSATWKGFFAEHWKGLSNPGGAVRNSTYINWEANTVHLAGMTVTDFDERHKGVTMEAVRIANERSEKIDERNRVLADAAAENKLKQEQELEAEKERARNVKFE